MDANGNDVVGVRTLNAESVPDADHVVQPTGGSGDGVNDPPASDPWTMDESFLNGFQGTALLESGRWITSGMETDSTIDWDSGPIYIAGTGVWGSVVEHEDGTAPTIRLVSSGGNGGGVRDLTVYGAGKGTGTAHIVESEGHIDSVFCDSIIRYGGGDGLHLKQSSSGTRVQNMWIESCTGNGIFVGGGDRLKLSDLHVVGNDGDQLNISMGRSHVDGVTLDGGNNGVLFEGGARNQFSNIVCGNVSGYGFVVNGGDGRNVIDGLMGFGCDTSLWVRSAGNNAVSNVGAFDTRIRGLRVSTKANALSNIIVDGFSSGSTDVEAVLLESDNNVLSNIYVGPGTRDGVKPMTISGDYNIIQNLILHPDITGALEVSGAENQIWGTKGLDYGQIADNGTRTMINGWSVNSGDPSTTGQWNGNAALAGRVGITVWDTSTSPWTPYEAAPDGSSWIAT